MSTKISSLFQSFLSALFPERDKEKIITSLSDEDISRLPPPQEQIKNVTALFSYKNTQVQALIWELKYHRNTEALARVGKLLAEHITEDISDKILFENW